MTGVLTVTLEQLRDAAENSTTGLVVTDAAGVIIVANPQVGRLFGYSHAELEGQPIELLVPRRAREQHVLDRRTFAEKFEGRSMGLGHDVYGIRKDGSEFPIEVGLNPVRTPAGSVVLAIVTDITARKQIEREREVLVGHLHRLAGQLIAAQDAERARIARDLHDDVNQQLAGLTIGLGALKRRVSELEPSEVTERLDEQISSLQDRSLGLSRAIRDLSRDLHPALLQHTGIVDALSTYCAEVRRDHSLNLSNSVDGDFTSIDPYTALCLYRVAQEALHNIVRHSGARSADLRLCLVDGVAELTITDNGTGFDVSQGRSKGLGLISISERARLVGGSTTITTELGKGTTLRVSVPVKRR